MKRFIESDTEGLEALMGERVTFWCMNYIYTGKLVGVNDRYIMLEDAAIVYETGEFGNKVWKDAQNLPHACYVMLGAVESFMVLK